jgi:hypothetical protein
VELRWSTKRGCGAAERLVSRTEQTGSASLDRRDPGARRSCAARRAGARPSTGRVSERIRRASAADR